MRLIALLVVIATPLVAQNDGRLVRGTVTDSTGRPIGWANVQTTGTNRVVADDSGRFSLRSPGDGEIGLRFYRIGYEPKMVTFKPRGDTTISVALTPLPSMLEAVTVEATKTSRKLAALGFYDRLNDRLKGVGSSSFITEDDIRQRNPRMISDMLRDVPGVRVAPGQGRSAVRDFTITGSNGCRFTIYSDGTRVYPTTSEVVTGTVGPSLDPNGSRRPPPGPSADDFPIDAIIGVSAAAGIEVYPRGVGAPGRFPRVASTCGVVVFWSK